MTFKTILSAAILAASLPLAAAAQDNAQPAGPAWAVACNSNAQAELVCRMTQQIRTQGGQRVITAVIFEGDAGLTMRVGLPHGLYLPSGVGMSVDGGDATIYTIETADQNGSYANIPLDPALQDAMRRGNTLVFTMDNATRNELKIEMSLSGFTRALGLML